MRTCMKRQKDDLKAPPTSASTAAIDALWTRLALLNQAYSLSITRDEWSALHHHGDHDHERQPRLWHIEIICPVKIGDETQDQLRIGETIRVGEGLDQDGPISLSGPWLVPLLDAATRQAEARGWISSQQQPARETEIRTDKTTAAKADVSDFTI